MKKDVTESEMSRGIGKNPVYIQAVSSGRAYPSMDVFFRICEYLGLEPAEFFDYRSPDPYLKNEVINALSGLSEDDLTLLLAIIRRLKVKGKP